MYRYIVFQAQDRMWYWHLVSSENRRIAESSEGFPTRHAAAEAANLVRTHAASAAGA